MTWNNNEICSGLLSRTVCPATAGLLPCCCGPSALPPQAFGLTSGKGGLVRLDCWTANSSFWSWQNALSNVVGQTPSFCFAVPPPSSGPLVLSLLFARKPVGAWHSRFGQPSPNILPRATRRVFRSTARRSVPAIGRFVA